MSDSKNNAWNRGDFKVKTEIVFIKYFFLFEYLRVGDQLIIKLFGFPVYKKLGSHYRVAGLRVEFN